MYSNRHEPLVQFGIRIIRINTGYQLVSLNGAFRRLLMDADLLVDGAGKAYTLQYMLNLPSDSEPQIHGICIQI